MTSALYQTGTVAVTAGSAVLSGTGTGWLASLRADNLVLVVAEDGTVAVHRIAAVGGDGAATIDPVYAGASASGLSYMALQTHLMVPSLLGAVQALIDSLSSTLDVEGSNGLLTLAKALTGDSAGTVLTTGGDYRWRWGAFGDDDFRLQRSADGVAWVDVIGIDRATGAVDLGAATITSATVLDLTVTGSFTGPGREVLSAARTYYVRPDGDDTNDGLSNAPNGAFLTVQGAYDRILQTIDAAGHDVTLKLAWGTYASAIAIRSAIQNVATFTLLGDASTPSNVRLAFAGGYGAFTIDGVAVSVSGVTVSNSGASGQGILVSNFGVLRISGNMDFGLCPNRAHIELLSNAILFASANYSVSGDSPRHIYATASSIVVYSSRTITYTVPVNHSWSFLHLDESSVGKFFTLTYTGAVTGQRYNVSMNSVVNTYGSGEYYFPGDVSGAVFTGGVYV